MVDCSPVSFSFFYGVARLFVIADSSRRTIVLFAVSCWRVLLGARCFLFMSVASRLRYFVAFGGCALPRGWLAWGAWRSRDVLCLIER